MQVSTSTVHNFERMIYPVLSRIAKELFFNPLWFRFVRPFSHQIVSLDPDDARETLRKYSPKPGGTCAANNEIISPCKYDLQIIVPAYNVEAYLKECIDSILNQKTKYTFKLVIIDDGSTDGTPEIADQYEASENVTIIHQSNKGLSGARNAGLKQIEGRYIAFMDADDFFTDGALDALLDAAYQTDADIVQGRRYLRFGSVRIPGRTSRVTGIGNIQDLYGQTAGKVYKSHLFENYKYPEGYLFEDTMNSFLIYPQASGITLLPDYVYEYRQRADSIVHTANDSPKSIDSYWITELLVGERSATRLPHDHDYYERVLKQILINGRRTLNTPLIIQQSIFSLSRELLQNTFQSTFTSKENAPLEEALVNNDFGLYRAYCRYH